MSITSCKRCGKLFHKISSDLCPACVRKEEADFEEIKHFLRTNENASIEDVVEALGIDEEIIIKFLRDGRLISSKKMAYPCVSCGKPINSGKYCDECRNKLVDTVNELKESLNEEKSKKHQSAYFSQRDKD